MGGVQGIQADLNEAYPSMPIIKLTRVSRIFEAEPPQRALRDVDLSIEAGEFVVVVGPSGSGKSTLLNVIGGLDCPNAGEVEVDGIDVSHANADELDRLRRHHVGFVFQSFHLNSRRTALQNVELPLLFADSSRPPAAAALECLRWVGMESMARRPVSTLSGGQRQRVALARALVGAPPVLLADEPVGNLDAATGADIVELLSRLNRDQGVTILAVSHDAHLMGAASRVLEMVSGELREVSSSSHARERGGAS